MLVNLSASDLIILRTIMEREARENRRVGEAIRPTDDDVIARSRRSCLALAAEYDRIAANLRAAEADLFTGLHDMTHTAPDPSTHRYDDGGDYCYTHNRRH